MWDLNDGRRRGFRLGLGFGLLGGGGLCLLGVVGVEADHFDVVGIGCWDVDGVVGVEAEDDLSVEVDPELLGLLGGIEASGPGVDDILDRRGECVVVVVD